MLVGVATEYNNALLVVENANIGWSTIEQIIEREYANLYYSSKSEQDTVETYMNKMERQLSSWLYNVYAHTSSSYC